MIENFKPQNNFKKSIGIQRLYVVQSIDYLFNRNEIVPNVHKPSLDININRLYIPQMLPANQIFL